MVTPVASSDRPRSPRHAAPHHYAQGIARRAARHGAHVGGNDGKYIQQGYDRHVADLNPDGHGRGGRPNLVSVMERNDLDEFLAIAELSDRDFTAERRAVVVSMGDGTAGEMPPSSKEDLKRAEELHADSLKVPRRPPWTRDMHPEELDQNERRHFLEWRRALAAVEEDERLTLTPFEKNLEIWRQLWRVCERSDIVVQVVDARDPVFYRCPDLEAYVGELSTKKKTMLLLNKADLLSPQLRSAWGDYFDENGISYLWWGARSFTRSGLPPRCRFISSILPPRTNVRVDARMRASSFPPVRFLRDSRTESCMKTTAGEHDCTRHSSSFLFFPRDNGWMRA